MYFFTAGEAPSSATANTPTGETLPKSKNWISALRDSKSVEGMQLTNPEKVNVWGAVNITDSFTEDVILSHLSWRHALCM